MHRALYRKWRPKTFDEVVGQNQVTDVLKFEVENGRISHAYLFCGSRGTGKTSCAKLLAKAVNCEHPVNGNPCNACASCRSIDDGTATDVIEMDAASNNGVDNVRDITEEIVFAPAALRYRVYIVDEVHMMSPSAFNALLKTLEEPPEHALFILATTELHKLPSTIVSRCQRFDFRRLTSKALVDRLMTIADAEGITLTKEGALLIARIAYGGMRDAISLFELCAGCNRPIDASLVGEMLGSGTREEIQSLAEAIAGKKYDEIFGAIHTAVMSSRDIPVMWRDLIAYYRDLMVAKSGANVTEYLDLTDIESEELKKTASLFTMEQLVYQTGVMEEALTDMQRPGFTARVTAEVALAKMCDARLSSSAPALLSRISELENKLMLLADGAPIAKAPPTIEPAEKKSKKTEVKSEPVKEKPVTETPPAPAPDDAQTYRALPYWQDVVEKISAGKKSIAGFLSGTKAYRSGAGAYLIRTKGGFAVNMLGNEENLKLIKAAISAEEGKDITSCEFTIEDGAGSGGRTVIDELEETLGQ